MLGTLAVTTFITNLFSTGAQRRHLVRMRCAGNTPLGGLAVLAFLAVAHTHDLGVDGRADAVVHLAVDLGQRIACTGSTQLQ